MTPAAGGEVLAVIGIREIARVVKVHVCVSRLEARGKRALRIVTIRFADADSSSLCITSTTACTREGMGSRLVIKHRGPVGLFGDLAP